MHKNEEAALMRLCIKAGLFDLDDFKDEVERAAVFNAAIQNTHVPLGSTNWKERVEDAKVKIAEMTEAYFERGELPHGNKDV